MSKSSKENVTNNLTKVPKSILVIGKLLQIISKNLTTHFAIKLFKTPIRYTRSEV